MHIQYTLMKIYWLSISSPSCAIFSPEKSSRVIQGCNSIEKLSHWAICQLTKMYVNLAKIGLSPSLIKVSVMNVLECSMFVQYNATCMTSSCFLLQLTHLWQDCNIIIFCCKRVDIVVSGYQLSEKIQISRQVYWYISVAVTVAALIAQFNKIGTEKRNFCARMLVNRQFHETSFIVLIRPH